MERLTVLLAAALWVVVLSFTSGADDEGAAAKRPNPHEAGLREMGVEPTREGIRKYLRRLHPTSDEQVRIAELIELLAAPQFDVREAATRDLLRMPQPPLAELHAAGRSRDLEVRWRARRILDVGGRKSAQTLYAALATIAHEEIDGAAAEVLAAIPLCHQEHQRAAARQALTATATPADASLLRRAADSEDAATRRAAVAAFGALRAGDEPQTLAGWLADKDPWVRYEAARALGNAGDRRALATLGELLSADDVLLRSHAAGMLRGLTRQSILFTAYDAPEDRQKQAAAWREWIAAGGETAELHFPVKSAESVEVGRTLIALYNEHRVLEVDRDGKVLLELKGYNGPWGARRLPNGNLLVNWFSSHTVIEYDAENNEVWSVKLETYPWSAERLANGNTLIGLNQKVIEIDRDGKTVWEVSGLGEYMADADRLENGNTLIVCMSHSKDGRVVEVDRAGEVVFEISGLKTPYRAQRLASGNTLVAEKRINRVVEFDPTGRTEVKVFEGLRSPDSAQRLANGNTLISDANGVREFDPSGKVVWEHKLSSDRSISRRY